VRGDAHDVIVTVVVINALANLTVDILAFKKNGRGLGARNSQGKGNKGG